MNYKIDDRLCELTDQITLDMGEMLLDIGLVKQRGLEVTVAAGGAGSDLRLSALTLKQNLKALNTMLDTYGRGNEELIKLSRERDEYDPTPWCMGCGSMTQSGCNCGPIAKNN